jgi:hypothetical protein
VSVEVRITHRGKPEQKPRNMNHKEEKLDE